MTSATRAIHAGCKQLGIDEDGRRAIYQRVTGKPKLTLMTPVEQEAVVTELRRLGFAVKPALVAGKYGKILQALWKAGWNLGVIVDRTDAALRAWVVNHQTNLSAVRFVHHADDGSAVVEGLKAWLAREARVEWTDAGLPRKAPERAHGYKIARAQWAILHPRGDYLFWSFVNDIIDQDELYRGHTDAEWIAVMNYLGKQVRAAKKGGA